MGIFIWSAAPDFLEFEGQGPADDYYNLLVQGFRAGQLNVKRDPSPGLTTLPNPYDPQANTPYVWDPGHPAFDMSYYKRKLYLYFGVTPAVVLFWPYLTVTGHYLPHKGAIVIFSVVGFAAAASFIYGIWRRYFPETNPWVAASGIMAVGLTSGLLEMLSKCTVYEVAISCGFAFAMMAFAAIWHALHSERRILCWPWQALLMDWRLEGDPRCYLARSFFRSRSGQSCAGNLAGLPCGGAVCYLWRLLCRSCWSGWG
jgi:hypothetical protein